MMSAEYKSEKPPLIVVAGPTGVGKSALSVRMAKILGGEVVSADSMQVYRLMNIGSAKICEKEMMNVPHHMIDVLDPDDEMDAAKYAELAGNSIRLIYERKHLPILCGGTGFYIQAVVMGTDFDDSSGPDPELRKELMDTAKKNGNESLHGILAALDPEAASAIHPNNLKRVIRAIEYARLTGSRISSHNKEEKKRESPYHTVFFFLDDERERLYARIDSRVDRMMEEGLLEEVKRLREMGLESSCISMQGIGYKEIFGYLEGSYDLQEAVRLIKRNSRRYAKRQETWFKRTEGAVRIMRGDFHDRDDEILAYMLEVIRDKTGIAAKGLNSELW